MNTKNLLAELENKNQNSIVHAVKRIRCHHIKLTIKANN